MSVLFISILIVLVFGVNVLWYIIKFTLKNNGYKVDWMYGHFKDIPNMYKLARETKNNTRQRRYYLMVTGLITGLILLIVIIVSTAF